MSLSKGASSNAIELDSSCSLGDLSTSENFTWNSSTGVINYEGLKGMEGTFTGPGGTTAAYSDLYNLFKAIEEGSAIFVKFVS